MKLRKAARPMTLEEHIELGQAIKNVVNDMWKVMDLTSKHNLLLSKDQDRMYRNLSLAYNELRSECEDKMFSEYPSLDNRAIAVYYHDQDHTTIKDIL